MGVGGGVRRIEVTERETPVFGGTEFGAVGPYERLDGAFKVGLSFPLGIPWAKISMLVHELMNVSFNIHPIITWFGTPFLLRGI